MNLDLDILVENGITQTTLGTNQAWISELKSLSNFNKTCLTLLFHGANSQIRINLMTTLTCIFGFLKTTMVKLINKGMNINLRIH